MFVFDTNVLSELMKLQPDARVADWTSRQRRDLASTTSISKAEILAGIAAMPFGRRRASFEQAANKIFELFAGRVLAFDEPAAAAFAHIAVKRRAAGRPIGMADLIIASIARSQGATVVTRDIGGFELTGIDLVNPWEFS